MTVNIVNDDVIVCGTIESEIQLRSVSTWRYSKHICLRPTSGLPRGTKADAF